MLYSIKNLSSSADVKGGISLDDVKATDAPQKHNTGTKVFELIKSSYNSEWFDIAINETVKDVFFTSRNLSRRISVTKNAVYLIEDNKVVSTASEVFFASADDTTKPAELPAESAFVVLKHKEEGCIMDDKFELIWKPSSLIEAGNKFRFIPTNTFAVKKKFATYFDNKSNKAVIVDSHGEVRETIDSYRIVHPLDKIENMIGVREPGDVSHSNDMMQLYSLKTKELIPSNSAYVSRKIDNFFVDEYGFLDKTAICVVTESPSNKMHFYGKINKEIPQLVRTLPSFEEIIDSLKNTIEFIVELNSLGEDERPIKSYNSGRFRLVKFNTGIWNIYCGGTRINSFPLKEISLLDRNDHNVASSCTDWKSWIPKDEKTPGIPDTYVFRNKTVHCIKAFTFDIIVDYVDFNGSPFVTPDRYYHWRYEEL